MNLIFVMFVISGITVSMFKGSPDIVTKSVMDSADAAVEMCISFIGIMSLWLGIGEIAQRSGLIATISRSLRPFTRILFPDVPPNHPAMGSLVMNMSANILGFGSAATPFGLKAMKDLQDLNPDPTIASDSMCTFLAINTSSITLIPATMVGLRAAARSANPADIVGTTIFATTVSTTVAIVVDWLFRNLNKVRKERF